jgi:hypothetical protein
MKSIRIDDLIYEKYKVRDLYWKNSRLYHGKIFTSLRIIFREIKFKSISMS